MVSPLNYDPSAYELMATIPSIFTLWTDLGLQQALHERVVAEKARKELLVHYYRIGHTLAFPLPVERRYTKADFPAGIATITYPWMIWLAWELEDRWRILHAAWRLRGDEDAGALFQRELAALAHWDCFRETTNQVGLVTAHIAGVLALALSDESGWHDARLEAVRHTADRLLNEDAVPWFAKTWPEGSPLQPASLHNIPVIALTRFALLARVCGHSLMRALDRQAVAVFHAWAEFRTSQRPHTEGTAYDGYLMDALTGWLECWPERDALLAEHRNALDSLVDQWLFLTLPGRPDLHVPLGDVEPEMPFWVTPLQRLANWLQREDALGLVRHFPISRLPAAALVEAVGKPFSGVLPSPALHWLANAVSVRSGWARPDYLAVLSMPRSGVGHLHADGGHFVLGWMGRCWITDPGYQQYRPGEERDYSIGIAAHNAPVVNGKAQDKQNARPVLAQQEAQGRAHVWLDLGACYTGLPATATVQRELWMEQLTTPLMVIHDRFEDVGNDAEILTHWLGGTHLAWTFVDGWARLSNGEQAVWIGAGELRADMLERHAGSRGPLTLKHTARLSVGIGEQWWVFWGDAAGGWHPPEMRVEHGKLTLCLPTGGNVAFGDYSRQT